jgi:DNA methylase
MPTATTRNSSQPPADYAVAENTRVRYGTSKPARMTATATVPRNRSSACVGPMLNNSNPGQVVYDPFLGSGTSIIAAETRRRICYGLEINPADCDLILQCWQDFRELAILESDHKTGEPERRLSRMNVTFDVDEFLFDSPRG